MQDAPAEELPTLALLDVVTPNIIRNNRWRCDHGWDVDLDDGSSNYEITNNLFLRGGLKLREGFHRRVWNNITVNNSFHPHVWYDGSGDEVTRNIWMGAYRPAGNMTKGKWGKEVDRNLFTTTDADRAKFAAHGCDAHSLVGDPQFVDAEHGDFRVKDGSPALKLGFKNFPMDQFGVSSPRLKALARTPEIPAMISAMMEHRTALTLWLGSKVRELEGEEYSAFGVAKEAGGVQLLEVPANSPAARADLRVGDLIESVNGKSVRTCRDLLEATKGVGGKPVAVIYIRNQARRQTWLYAADKPGSSKPPMHFGDATRLGRPFAKDPSVIRFGGRYLLYYSVAAWAKELAPPDAPRGWAIGISESHDLVNWKKVGEILPEQECEKNGIVNGRIILLDGKLHLFYNTYGNGPKDALCHAWSADGIHFTRNLTNPIWHPTGDWNNGRAIDVDVVEWGDDIIMYYATRDPAGKIQMLHAIAAPRKSGFNRGDWKSLRDGPVLRPELPWEKSCIEAPSVIKRGDTLYLFYGGGYNNDPQQIGCAVSKDGIHFQRLFTDKPLLPNGAPGQWNSSESGHPGMFEDGDGQIYMFYQGNNDRGRTWFLSWVKIGWDGDKPRVIEPHVD